MTKSEKTPNGNWQVHKEYDEQGNLVSMDSIYSYSRYSNGMQLEPQERDSLMQKIHDRMRTNFESMGNDQNLFSITVPSDSIQQIFFNQEMNGNFDQMHA